MSRIDSRELRELMLEYTGRLLPVARSFADGVTEAEDILQDVWIKVSETLHERSPDAPLGAWLYRITLNVGLSHRRRRERRRGLREGKTGWWDRELDETKAPSIEGEQARSLLWKAVAELPDLQKKVLLMRVVDGMSTSEVADALGRAEGTVKTSLHRSLGKLRKKLGSIRGFGLE
jgi:RNA polymerase sigma-70 factor (ECF subfamily)